MSTNTWTTYRMEDGSLIFGEYAWVDAAEFFDGVTEPIKVVKETWVLQSAETIVFEPFKDWYDQEYDEWYEED